MYTSAGTQTVRKAARCDLHSTELTEPSNWIAKAFAKSFVLSVFPVPAGPSGAPP